MPPPPPIKTSTITAIGTALFGLALILTLVIAQWHSGENRWYPWAAGAGFALGLLGLLYLRRGRGNAALAEENAHPEAYRHD